MILEIPIQEEINPLTAQFRMPVWEHSYRQVYLNNDRIQSSFAVILTNIFITIFIFSDYQFFGTSRVFYGLFAARSIFFLISAACLGILWRQKDERFIDKLNFFWGMFFVSFALAVSVTRPSGYPFFLVLNIVTILALYILLPNRFLLQIIPGMYLTAGIVISLFTQINLPLVSNLVIEVAILISNIVGLYLSWRFHIDKRTQFRLLRQEKELSQELTKVVETTKTLKGLLPICASCKKIRNDTGYWEDVAVYVRDHTEAEFSHGICPDCAQKLYPEFFKKP